MRNAICESPISDRQTIVDMDADKDSPVQGIRVYIPFEGTEAICRDCKDQRYVMIDMTLQGKTLSWSDWCGDPFNHMAHPFQGIKRAEAGGQPRMTAPSCVHGVPLNSEKECAECDLICSDKGRSRPDI